ncbi:MAG: c-type cytochrome [Planctomycetota bacterium]|jgi:cytochrome c551/c552
MASDPSPVKNDRIVKKSLSWPMAVASVLLVLSTIWALYDEVYGRRPWKAYQSRFVKVYSEHLETLKKPQAKREKEVRGTEEFLELQEQLEETEKASSQRIMEIDRQLNKIINPQLSALTEILQVARSEVSALTYKIEVAGSDKKKNALKKQLAEIKKGPFILTMLNIKGDYKEVVFDFDGAVKAYDNMKTRKANLLSEKGALIRPPAKIRARRNEFFSRQMGGLTTEQVEGLQRKMASFEYGIKQIHVADIGLVDRCETCHLGIREPTPLRKEDMEGESAFTSHPQRELLKIHDPEQFGCSPCHGGNGVATTSVQKAHGQYRHWLWPLYDRENVEAGCLQCHESALQLEHADTLNTGKELFRHYGCWACHPRDGFDTERSRLQDVTQSFRAIDKLRANIQKAIEDAQLVMDDDDSTDEQVFEALQLEETLTLKLSELDTEEQQLSLKQRSLFMERKDVAPNLKDIRAKIRSQWLPYWLGKPREFRPTTRMPVFNLSEDQIEAISAFIWQAGVEPRLRPQPKGDPETGKDLFDKRGCLGCHSVGETDEGSRYGVTFSTDLLRIGEKVNYDYLVRWIHNPRERILPFCEVCGRDIMEKDYQKAGIPFRFDIDHSYCPVCGSEMQVQNQTVMPSLRLSELESRDIASYLMTLEDPHAVYPKVDYINDSGLYEKGKKLAAHYGCMGCHEIAGMETLDKIGTDLTKAGAKPIERLDFGLLTHEAERKGWYSHKGFFEKKLADSSIFDQGKLREPHEKLRMPEFGLSDEKINALTTFLLGSVESQFPERYHHNPNGFEEDIITGWWTLKKYNCVGCHQIITGVKPPILDLPQYADEDVILAPPSLVGEGARVDPVWLVSFLRDPALSDTDVERNGVRPYLDVRMPTYTFSEGEISKLVRFFNAMSKQPSPYLKPPAERLTDAELVMARDVFVEAECMKCHASGDQSSFTQETTAPNFLLAEERLKPRWMERWMIDPARLMPGTEMPTGLFDRKDDRWILSGVTPQSMADYQGDHVKLFVRYMQQFTEEEARVLKEKKK